jgi:hypothetical protein
VDEIGANNGTNVGNATFGSGQAGQGFVFDGITDSVNVGNPTNLQLQTFSLEAWIKRAHPTRATQGAQTSGSIFSGSSGSYALGLLDDGRLFLTKVGVSAVFSTAAITDTNSFHHVAVTKSGGDVVLYLDGVAEAVGPYDPGFVFTGPMAIGARGGDYASSFFGSIDELSIYGRALAIGEIQAIYNAGSAGKCVPVIPPFITVHPTNQTALVGDTVTFNVTATGTQPLHYVWLFNETNIVGTNVFLTLTNVQPANAGVYSVVVSNSAGTATSSNVLLTIEVPPPCATKPSGIVSWWKAESNALDEVDSNNGTIVGNVTYVSGKVGRTFRFDGLSSGVSLGNPTNLQLQNFTVEAWARRADANRAAVAPYDNGAFLHYGLQGYVFAPHNDGRLLLGKVGSTAVYSSVLRMSDTNFHHVAVTKNGSTVVFYLDGVAESVGPYDPGFVFNTPVAIGARGGDMAAGLIGDIDELTVYDRALTSNEIQAIYNAGDLGKCPVPPQIVVQPQNRMVFVGEEATFAVTALGEPLTYQWRFNAADIPGATNGSFTLPNAQMTNAGFYSVLVSNFAGSALSSNAQLSVFPAPPCTPPLTGLISWWRGESNALDSIGANHGALTNQATYERGKAGAGFAFDGLGDAVHLGNPPALQLQDFTMEAWIKRASVSKATGDPGYTQGAILYYGSGGYGLAVLDDGRLSLAKVGFSQINSTLSVTDTSFHHVAVCKSGSSVTFYVDGTAQIASPYNPGFTFGTAVAIGARGSDLAAGFLGTIDEVGVYNRALTTNEVQAIYNAGPSGKCVVPVPPVIVAHPRDTNALVGNTVSFTVVAGGSVPFGYQWRFNGTNLPGATASTLVLTNAQMSQAGSYAVQVTNGVGSVLSSNATLSLAFPAAVVRAGNTNVMAGRSVTVPVTLAANGIENGLGFSLNYNPQRLAFAGATLGSGAAGATLFVNTSLTATGRLGIAVAFPPQLVFPAGTQEVVRVAFDTLPLSGGASVNATNNFADQPVLRELYDAQLQPLPAFYSNGIVTLLPTVFEGDVFPRPSGNQTVAATDWAQAGRFAARLDTAAPGAEFQRADTAPRATLGDGQIKVTDWVQTGRYLAGLDPLAAVGGPTNETIIGSANSPVSRQLRAVGTNVVQQQNATVSIRLEAQGDENAVGFTLNFNPTAFALADVSLGSGAAGANLVANASQAGAGRLGVALALPAGANFAAGSRELVQVRLAASPDVAGPFALTLSDDLVTRCASDALADELPVNYVNGTMTIVPSNPNPTLTITQAGTNVVLSWPLWAADFTLQALEGPNGLSGGWTNLSPALQTNGASVVATLPIANESKYFRLWHP